MGPYAKSLVWLVSSAAVGYGLMVVFSPGDDFSKELREKSAKNSPVEVASKNQQFLNVLKAAAQTNKPLHSADKQEREDLLPKKN